MGVKDYYGNDVNFDAAVALMDDDIREQLHDQTAPCTEQESFDAYAKAHAEKFDGEEFAPYYNLARQECTSIEQKGHRKRCPFSCSRNSRSMWRIILGV